MTRVYDWCIADGTLSFPIADLPAPPPETAGAVCHILAADCAVLGCRQSGNGVAIATLRKTVTFQVTFMNAEGQSLAGGIRSRFADEFVTLCAPEGATVRCEILNIACRAAIVASHLVQVDVFLCQSVQSEAEAKACLEADGFCAPDSCC